jgi:hypothetical protein
MRSHPRVRVSVTTGARDLVAQEAVARARGTLRR